MGLFKTLLNSVAGKTLDQVKDAVNNFVQSQTGGNQPASGGGSRSSSNPEPARQQYEPAQEVDRTDAEWKAYFREILQSECIGYGIREDVPVTDIVGPAADEFKLYETRPTQVYRAEWGKPYTFVLSQGGLPKAVVMLGSGHSHYSNVKYLIARMYAKKAGLPYINFYTPMPNERGYVVERIRKFL